MMAVNLSPEQDKFIWSLTAFENFTGKFMYLDYMNEHTKYFEKYIWKMKVPLKIKIFMWFFHRKVILTKDNLMKRNWQGSTTCCFCDKEESIQHLLFEYPLAKIVWRLVHMTFVLPPPKNVKNLFCNWRLVLTKKM
jgi:hypothetical protein